MKPKPMKGKYWAYFAPNGYLQVRSIAETKKLAREMIAKENYDKSWKDYEIMGFYLLKVDVDIQSTTA